MEYMSLNKDVFSDLVYRVTKKAATSVSDDCLYLLRESLEKETVDHARMILSSMIKNAKMAEKLGKSVCQSPGYPVYYIGLGNFLIPFRIKEVVGDVLIRVTKEGVLRPSMVHPISRKNTGDNSGINVPDIEIENDPSLDYCEVVVDFKGCGAELFNRTKVFQPSEIGPEGIGVKNFIIESVIEAGGGPCPPVAIGVGIGGQLHQAAKLSRRAIGKRPWNDKNKDKELAKWESELKEKINKLGIGPAGLGGDTTCLAVKIEQAYTHTAILPVVVNFHCWPARRARGRIYEGGRVEILGW